MIDDFSSGLSLDALRSSHPIQVDVKSPSEISQIFDAISYSKGASVIRMLNAFLGQETFMTGVRSYLKKFAYQNAMTSDLWTSLTEASQKDVESLMYSWTRHMGYPIVTIFSEEYDADKKEMTLHLKQSRFLSSGDLTEKEDSESPLWWIPLSVVTNLSPSSPSDHILKEKQSSITFPYEESDKAYFKLNYGTTGFFRVKMSPERLTSLSKCIAENPDKFSTPDRIGIIMDAFSLGKAGYAGTVAALEVVKNYGFEENYVYVSLFLVEADCQGLE